MLDNPEPKDVSIRLFMPGTTCCGWQRFNRRRSVLYFGSGIVKVRVQG